VPEDALSLFTPLGQDDLLVLISQDCDIVCYSYELEPYVELLTVRRLQPEEKDGGRFHGKNPRRLQFTLLGPEGNQLYEVNIHEKSRIDRKLLETLRPRDDVNLDPDLIRLLARWTAKRYTRSAFPDTFNERCRPAAPKIAKRFKARGELLTAVFLRLDTLEELPDETDYRVIMSATALPEDLEDLGTEEEALRLLREVEEALNDCPGIRVVEAELVSEDDFTLTDVRETLRWDYDFLSYREGEPQQIAPAE
jgi:hypothetical protein